MAVPAVPLSLSFIRLTRLNHLASLKFPRISEFLTCGRKPTSWHFIQSLQPSKSFSIVASQAHSIGDSRGTGNSQEGILNLLRPTEVSVEIIRGIRTSWGRMATSGGVLRSNAAPDVERDALDEAIAPPRKKTRVRPEGVFFDWRYSLKPGDVLGAVDDLISRMRVMYDSVGKLKPEEVTFDNVLKVLDEIDNISAMEYYPLMAGQHIAVSPELTAASSEASKKWNEFEVEMEMRQDIFGALLALDQKLDKLALGDDEAKRYLEKMIFDGKRIGLHLSGKDRKRIEEIAKELGDLKIQFRRNLDENDTMLEFTAEELKGTPEVTLSTMDKTPEGKYIVTMHNPHVKPILRSCKNSQTRKRVLAASFSRCSARNGPILQRMLDLRHEKSQILGFKNHADYVLQDRVAKTTKAVDDFLGSLAQNLDSLWKEERRTWMRHKYSQRFPETIDRRLPGKEGSLTECRDTCDDTSCDGETSSADDSVGFIADWDYSYLMNLSNVKDFHVDHEKIQQYFPTEKVVPGVLKIFEKVLSLKFKKIQDAETWHESVKMYEVKDAESAERMGYFFLDLFPRDGKYGHAAMFELQPKWKTKEGKVMLPVCAVLTNFTPSSTTMPALMTHGELTTFFHEFGHVMHEICRKNKFYAFGLNGVDTDFVEAPSQMLENWAWEPQILRTLSSHFKTGEPLPDEVISSLVKSHSANAGGQTLRQILLARLDQELHSGDGTRDPAKVYRHLQKLLMGMEPIEGTNFPAHFGHLAGGYDASYYGYLWSEVYSADMYHSAFKKNGKLDAAAGLKYRRCILEPGGSKDPKDMLQDFLGREPSNTPFLLSKGIKVHSDDN